MDGFGDIPVVLVEHNKGSLETVDAPLPVVLNRVPFLEGRRVDVNLALFFLVQGHKLIVRKHKIKVIFLVVFVA
jgi:hypothetical protein